MIRLGLLAAALLAAETVAADPGFQQVQRLSSEQLRQGDRFGAAVAVGDDVIAVGAYLANGGSGGVYLFSKGTAGWSDKPIVVPGRAGEWFGFDLAIDAAGKTLVIGAPSPGKVGRIYLYELASGALGPAVEGGSAGDEFGSAVSTDGEWLAVGARGARKRAGRVYVFPISGKPQEPLQLSPEPAAGAELGQSVSLRGKMLAAGAPLPGNDGSSPGAAYVSRLAAGGWTRLEQAPGPTGLSASAAFGYSLSVLDEAGNIAVGAPLADLRGTDSGVVYLPLNGPSFEGNKGDQLGVAVAADGGLVVIGARGAGASQGAAYLYNQGEWKQLPHPGAKGDEFGFSVAIREKTVAIGAFREGGTGAVYVFEPGTPACEPGITLTPPEGPLTTRETGTSLTFKVRLTCKPASTVSVTFAVAGDVDEATVAPSSLSFSTENWNLDRSVTVTGLDDSECDGPREYSLQAGSLKLVTIKNLDDDDCLSATQTICVTPDDVAVFEVTVRNLGTERIESGSHPIELPEDVRVAIATTDRGVVTVDQLDNSVVWNGSLPAGREALITILAPLEPDAVSAYDPCP